MSTNLPTSIRAGYTLVELLITITISTILITIGVSAYRRAADLQQIRFATETILNTLSSAQKAATTGIADCSGPYLGEQISYTANGSTLTLTATCLGGEGSSKTFSIEPLTFANTGTLTFRPLNQGVNTGASDTHYIDYATTDRTHRIEVSRSGTITPLGVLP